MYEETHVTKAVVFGSWCQCFVHKTSMACLLLFMLLSVQDIFGAWLVSRSNKHFCNVSRALQREESVVLLGKFLVKQLIPVDTEMHLNGNSISKPGLTKNYIWTPHQRFVCYPVGCSHTNVRHCFITLEQKIVASLSSIMQCLSFTALLKSKCNEHCFVKTAPAVTGTWG